jgi:hypothetical protein
VTVLHEGQQPGSGAQNSSHSTHQQYFVIVFVPHTTWQTFFWQGPQLPQSAQQSGVPQPPAGACCANARQAAMLTDIAKILMIRSSL